MSVEQVNVGVSDVAAVAADEAHMMRTVLTLVGTEIRDCPRLFTLTRSRKHGIQKIKVHQNLFELTLWCEHPGHWHPWPQARYEIERPTEWIRQISRYARPILAVLKATMPVAGDLAGLVLTTEQAERAEHELALMADLMDEYPDVIEDGQPVASTDGPDVASGAALRGVRELLRQVDRYQQFGGLTRIVTASGELLWVCSDHTRGYEPGLPILAVPVHKAADTSDAERE